MAVCSLGWIEQAHGNEGRMGLRWLNDDLDEK